jgi:hypothetical protein
MPTDAAPLDLGALSWHGIAFLALLVAVTGVLAALDWLERTARREPIAADAAMAPRGSNTAAAP